MKNNRIQFWRIIMTYIIAFYHLNKAYEIYTSGYIAVEFFFIVSGFLLMDKMDRTTQIGLKNKISPLKYTAGKFERYFPHSAVAFFTAFLAVGVFKGYGFKEWIRGLITHLPELFLVNMVGLPSGGGVSYNDITWYLSALLILSYFIWLMIRWNKEIYSTFIAPMSVLVIYPLIYRNYGTLCVHEDIIGIFSTALLRGFADINLGIIGFYTCKWFKENNLNQRRVGLISSICLAFGGVIIPQFFYERGYDFFMLLLIFSGVTLSFACVNNKVFDNVLIEKWADFTIVIYLNHQVIKEVISMVFMELNPVVYVLYFIVITIYSLIVYKITNLVVIQIKRKMVID